MASQNPHPASSWFRRDAPPSSSIPQRNRSNRLPSKLATPRSASSLPITTASSQRPPTKLTKTKKIPEEPRPGPSGGSASVQQRVVPSVKSSGGAGLHRENNHGSESHHGPLHPTKTRVPRFDAATTRTPPLAAASSLASGSSAASTQSSRRTAVLRRKPSSIGRPSLRSRTVTEPSVMMHPNGSIANALSSTTPEPYSDTVLGVAMPFAPPSPLVEERQHPPDSQPQNQADPASLAHTDCMEQERLNQLYASNRSQSTPAYALSASPSTRCSESPGHFSHASSSTSMSSPSPGMVSRVRSRTRQISPITIRPPLDRSKTDGPTLTVPSADRRGKFTRYESTNSSSSSSTVVGGELGRRERKVPIIQKKEEHLEAPKIQAAEKLADPQENISQAPPVSVPKLSTEQPTYPPPELAHLADVDNKPPVSTHLPRPARPSREGTQDLSHLQRPSPVVQSNLTSLPIARHRRQISSGSVSPGSFASRITSPQTSNSSKKPSVSTNATSPNPSLPDSLLSPISTNESGVEERSRGLSPGNGTSRFGFFSRKSPAPEHGSPSAVLRKEKRGLRKGPAAGTGHEGYGKYGIGRGRSISTNSLASSVGRSPSSESITSNHAGRQPSSRKDSYDNTYRKDNMAHQKEIGMDDFLRNRLQPVILRGEGNADSSTATSSDAAVSTSSLSSGPARAATAPRNDSNTSLAAIGSQRPSVDHNRPTLLPSSMTDSIRGKSPLKALAGRHKRTVSHDSNLSVEPSPQYPNTTYGASGSKKVTISSPSADPSRGRLQKKEKDSPSKLDRKWNFFQRAQSVPKKAPTPSTPFQQSMPFTVPSSLPLRAVAHYELDESEEKPVNIRELELMMEEVAQAADDSEKERSRPPSSQGRRKSHDSVLLPPPPILRWPFESADTSPLTSPTVSRYLDPELQQLESARFDLNSPATTPFSQLSKETQVPQADSKNLGAGTGDGPPLPIENTAQAAPKVTPEFMQAKSPLEQLARPSRLQQVGRIPHVVSTGDRRRNPNHSSFSRPFGPDLPSPGLTPPKHALELPLGESRQPDPSDPQTPSTSSSARDSIIPRPLFCNGSGIANYDEPALQGKTSGRNGAQIPEFLAFPRKYSEISYTSSSNAGTSSYALTPGPYIPPEEDEVWREYDDLIDEVMSSPENRTPKSKDEIKRANLKRGSMSGKFVERISRLYSDQTPTSWLQDSSRPGTVFEEYQDGNEQIEVPNPFAGRGKAAVVHFEDSNVSPKTARLAQNPQTSVHLRRSQMLANFQPLAMLSTQGPASTVSPEGPKDFSFADPEGRLSLPSMRLSLESAEPTSGAPKLADSTNSSSEGSKTVKGSSMQSQPPAHGTADVKEVNVEEPVKPNARYRDSRLMEIAEYQNDGVISMANLRVGALKTSKWLSFGRVLFSPAHSDLENSNDERVLILDGLGKDWSYFCALTYPRTHFYYLSPAPSSSSQPSTPINPPPNYTHIHHSHASAPFPFPRGFFAAVVYRFPTAAPESVYRVIVGECKRVLRPGGYLELSAIDLDLVNMGQHARKVVRDLKWAMQNAEADMCLANASDVLLRLVGRRGFEGIKRGVVGVPVSGSLKKSGESGLDSTATATADNSASASSTNPSGNPSSTQLTGASSSTSPTIAAAGTTPDMEFGPDLSSMASASSTAPSGDDNMISRVGRWWYSRCYETSMFPRHSDTIAAFNNGSNEAETAAASPTVGSADKKTMFADAKLLRECEERGTNFRLLICYAQKPEQARRRTVSV